MLQDKAGHGIPYIIVQDLTSVAKTIEYTLLAADVNAGALVDLAGKMQGQGFSVTMPIPVVSGGSWRRRNHRCNHRQLGSGRSRR